LAVTVKHHNNVRTIIECNLVASLLVASITLIGRIANYKNWELRIAMAVFKRLVVRVVSGGVIADND
jgi:hypothetical protein